MGVCLGFGACAGVGLCLESGGWLLAWACFWWSLWWCGFLWGGFVALVVVACLACFRWVGSVFPVRVGGANLTIHAEGGEGANLTEGGIGGIGAVGRQGSEGAEHTGGAKGTEGGEGAIGAEDFCRFLVKKSRFLVQISKVDLCTKTTKIYRFIQKNNKSYFNNLVNFSHGENTLIFGVDLCQI